MDMTVKTLLEKLIEPAFVNVRLMDIDNDLFEGSASEAIYEYGHYIVESFDIGSNGLVILIS